MRAKKLLKITGITLLSLVVLLLLFIVAFVFNPFEGSLPNIRDVVPRNVDFFLRKENLAGDLAEFPEPLFWEELSKSGNFRDLQRTPIYRDWSVKVQNAVVELRRAAEQMHEAWLVPEHLFGAEVLIAGRVKSARLDESSWCIYLRVNWRLRAAWGLAGYTFVQERLRREGIVLRPDGELFEVKLQDQPQPYHAARYRDCIMVGSDRQLVADSLELAKGAMQAEGFGNSGFYQTGIKERVESWQKLAKVPDANTLELFVNTDAMFQRVTWDDRWPDENAANDMNQRVLARFVNFKGWKYLAGALAFEPESVTALGRIDLNRNLHTPFQSAFFKAEQQPRSTWLDPFLRMVPLSACAAAGMRMPAGDFMREMFRSLDKREQSLIEDGLKKTGQFSSYEELVTKLELALEPRTGFVFRKNVPDPQIPVADTTVVPQVAWVFWLKEMHKKQVEDLLQLMLKHHQTLGFPKAFQLPVQLSAGPGGDAVLEFTNPQIPGTGEIAAIVFDKFLLVGNSGPLIKEMIRTRYGEARSIREHPDFEEFNIELPNTVNGFVFVQGAKLEDVFREYDQALVATGGEPDPEWQTTRRPSIEVDVFAANAESFKPARKHAELTGEGRKRFEELVRVRLQELWQNEGSAITTASREHIRQLIAIVRLVSSAYVHVELDETSFRFGGRVKLKYRSP